MFSENLKYLRKLHKYTQSQLAEELLVNQRTISDWENSISEPDLSMLLKIKELFNESIDNLLE